MGRHKGHEQVVEVGLAQLWLHAHQNAERRDVVWWQHARREVYVINMLLKYEHLNLYDCQILLTLTLNFKACEYHVRMIGLISKVYS